MDCFRVYSKRQLTIAGFHARNSQDVTNDLTIFYRSEWIARARNLISLFRHYRGKRVGRGGGDR